MTPPLPSAGDLRAEAAQVCSHGSLRRSCELCDLTQERDTLLASLAQVTQERDAYAGKLHRLQARTPERALAAAQAENARLNVAVDAADLLMAQFIGVELPTKAWQSWRSQHRQALCDPAPLPKQPTTP